MKKILITRYIISPSFPLLKRMKPYNGELKNRIEMLSSKKWYTIGDNIFLVESSNSDEGYAYNLSCEEIQSSLFPREECYILVHSCDVGEGSISYGFKSGEFYKAILFRHDRPRVLKLFEKEGNDIEDVDFIFDGLFTFEMNKENIFNITDSVNWKNSLQENIESYYREYPLKYRDALKKIVQEALNFSLAKTMLKNGDLYKFLVL